MAELLFRGLNDLQTILRDAETTANRYLQAHSPIQLILASTFLTVLICWAYCQLFTGYHSFWHRTKAAIFSFGKRLPFVSTYIAKELDKTRNAFYHELHKADPNGKFFTQLPAVGFSEDEIHRTADVYNLLGTYRWSEGKVSGTVYNAEADITRLVGKIYEKFAWTNPLHPDVFPGIRKIEAEVVRMCCDMFHGDEDSCGTVSTGGTESILLACLAYRNLAYQRGISQPEMVVPITAHAAFDKAADYFRIRIKHVPIDPTTCQVDLRAMRRAITSSTCMLVGSAPHFPHGIIDPIEEISQLGLKYGIPVHVDACLGGFLIAFMDEAGFPLPTFDFRLVGVTSISCDTHKYGFATKGSSVVLYRHFNYLKHQFFCQPDWPGGIYASPTLGGSRCGANIATCWATMLYFGRNGYVDMTRKIIQTARKILNGLRQLEGLEILGNPEVSVIAFNSHRYCIYTMNDKLNNRGWNLNLLQFPPAIHFCLTGRHTKPGVAEKFLKDMGEIVAELLINPGNPKEGKAAMYGMSQSIPDRTLVNEFAFSYFEVCYSTKGSQSYQNVSTKQD